jgi:hypothetical protein
VVQAVVLQHHHQSYRLNCPAAWSLQQASALAVQIPGPRALESFAMYLPLASQGMPARPMLSLAVALQLSIAHYQEHYDEHFHLRLLDDVLETTQVSHDSGLTRNFQKWNSLQHLRASADCPRRPCASASCHAQDRFRLQESLKQKAAGMLGALNRSANLRLQVTSEDANNKDG